MTLQEMVQKIRNQSRMAKSYHLFASPDDPSKVVMVLSRFDIEFGESSQKDKGRIIGAIELDKSQMQRLIRELTTSYRAIERKSINEKGEKA